MFIQVKVDDPGLVGRTCPIEVTVYNPAGERVAILDARGRYGINRISFDTTSLAGGIYFYRLRVNGQDKGIQKLVLYKY